MRDSESRVNVCYDDTVSRRSRPRRVGAASEDVPLVFEAGNRIQHHLVAVPHQRFRQRSTRRWYDNRDRYGSFNLPQAAQSVGDFLYVGIGWEVESNEMT